MTHPFSRPVFVDAIPADGSEIAIEAKPDERAALAEIDGLVDIDRLLGRFRLRPQQAGGVRVRGSVEARVTQTCTVSLDPFEADVVEDVDVTFLPQAGFEAWQAKQKAKADDVQTMEEDDPPDLIIDGRIDLGVLAAEFLALGLDPYPRKPGVTFDAPVVTDRDPSPFAALAKLKREP